MTVKLDIHGADDRLNRCFQKLRHEDRAGLVPFVTAFDPTPETSFELLCRLPEAGADVIELGVPFSDPMADGPAIQLANQRAFRHGVTLAKTLDMVSRFRLQNSETPIILMGYYNPIYRYGVDAFIEDALSAGVDGLIVVDLPPEVDDELCVPALKRGLHFIHLAAPTTDDERLPHVLKNSSGYVYYVSIAGITGTKDVDDTHVAKAVERIKAQTELPIAVGFGIKTPEQAAKISGIADGVVVGSAIINRIADQLDAEGNPKPDLVEGVLSFVSELARGVVQGRSQTKKAS